jgi:hypothetical protein
LPEPGSDREPPWRPIAEPDDDDARGGSELRLTGNGAGSGGDAGCAVPAGCDVVESGPACAGAWVPVCAGRAGALLSAPSNAPPEGRGVLIDALRWRWAGAGCGSLRWRSSDDDRTCVLLLIVMTFPFG